MKFIAIDRSETVISDIPKGCFYPKGSVVEFADGESLVDFISLLPDDVWDYWQDSTTKIKFKKAYYLEVE